MPALGLVLVTAWVIVLRRVLRLYPSRTLNTRSCTAQVTEDEVVTSSLLFAALVQRVLGVSGSLSV